MESNGETETPNKDENKKDQIDPIQTTPTIKKIKINVKEKKSSTSIKSVTKEPEVTTPNIPFSIHENISQKVQEKETVVEQEKKIIEPLNDEVSDNRNNGNSDKNQEKPTFSLFSNKIEGTSLFSGSLFANNNNKGSLFGSNGSALPNLFSNLKSSSEGGNLFNFSNLSAGGNNFFNKKNDSEEDGSDGEDDKQEKRSDSPEVYRPTTEKTTGPYSKKYVKLVENFFVYNKKEKKYLSKGDGFFSIEYIEEPKKSALFVFR